MPLDLSKIDMNRSINVAKTILDKLTKLTNNDKLKWFKTQNSAIYNCHYGDTNLTLLPYSRKASKEKWQICLEENRGIATKQSATFIFTVDFEDESSFCGSEYPSGSLFEAIKIQNDRYLSAFMDKLLAEEQHEEN